MTELSSRVRSVLPGGAPVPVRRLARLWDSFPRGAGTGERVPLVRASRLLSLPVRVDGILLGHVVDVFLSSAGRGAARGLGLEVRCGDGEHRFLPLAATHFRDGELVVSSPLALLDPAQLTFYASRGTSFRALGSTDLELELGS